MSCADPAPQNSIAIHSLSLLETQKGSFHNIALHNLIVRNFTQTFQFEETLDRIFDT